VSALFCHDHRFVLAPDGRVFSSGQYDRATVARYEAVFGPLTIAGRWRPLEAGDDVAALSLVMAVADHFVPLPSLSSLRGLLLGDPAVTVALRAAVEGVEVVIARLPSELGLVAADEAQRAGKPLIAEVVACVKDGLARHGSAKAALYAPIAYRRMRRAIARAPFVHYVTQQFLQDRYPATGTAVGVSDVEIAAPDLAVLDRRLASIVAVPQARTFGMVAALFHKEKGVDVAMRALADARRTDPALRLKVAGPGDPAPWLRYAAEIGVADAVELVGMLPRGEAVLRWLDGIDVYVQASFQEGLPRALIEALSRATPALASSAGGTAELIEAEWRHQPGDHRRLAAQMLAIRGAEVRCERASANFATASGFAPDRLAARRDAFWRQALESAR